MVQPVVRPRERVDRNLENRGGVPGGDARQLADPDTAHSRRGQDGGRHAERVHEIDHPGVGARRRQDAAQPGHRRCHPQCAAQGRWAQRLVRFHPEALGKRLVVGASLHAAVPNLVEHQAGALEGLLDAEGGADAADKPGEPGSRVVRHDAQVLCVPAMQRQLGRGCLAADRREGVDQGERVGAAPAEDRQSSRHRPPKKARTHPAT